MREEHALLAGLVLGGFGPLSVGAALSPLRDHSLVASVVVLVLIVVIATAAVLGGPLAGAAATVTAALTFDFLFVRPYLVLKVGPGHEVWPAALLAVVGVAIVIITRRRWPPSTAVAAPATSNDLTPSQRIERVIHLIGHGSDPGYVLAAVEAEVMIVLLARKCRFEAGDDTVRRPRLERNGSVGTRAWQVELPPGELELPVRVDNHDLGRLVLDPTPGVPVPLDRRIVAVILTDHLAAAISGRSPTVPPRT